MSPKPHTIANAIIILFVCTCLIITFEACRKKPKQQLPTITIKDSIAIQNLKTSLHLNKADSLKYESTKIRVSSTDSARRSYWGVTK